MVRRPGVREALWEAAARQAQVEERSKRLQALLGEVEALQVRDPPEIPLRTVWRPDACLPAIRVLAPHGACKYSAAWSRARAMARRCRDAPLRWGWWVCILAGDQPGTRAADGIRARRGRAAAPRRGSGGTAGSGGRGVAGGSGPGCGPRSTRAGGGSATARCGGGVRRTERAPRGAPCRSRRRGWRYLKGDPAPPAAPEPAPQPFQTNPCPAASTAPPPAGPDAGPRPAAVGTRAALCTAAVQAMRAAALG